MSLELLLPLLPLPPPLPHPQLVSLRVEVTEVGGRTDAVEKGGPQRRQLLKLTIEVPRSATVRAVKRGILEKRALPLLTNVLLTHAGQRLEAQQQPPDWQAFSIVHAVLLLSEDNELTLENLATHPAVAEQVVRAGVDGDGADSAEAANRGGVLWIADSAASAPLGNGAFGAVFPGTARFGRNDQVSQSVSQSPRNGRSE